MPQQINNLELIETYLKFKKDCQNKGMYNLKEIFNLFKYSESLKDETLAFIV
jgi:hypothetical protein